VNCSRMGVSRVFDSGAEAGYSPSSPCAVKAVAPTPVAACGASWRGRRCGTLNRMIGDVDSAGAASGLRFKMSLNSGWAVGVCGMVSIAFYVSRRASRARSASPFSAGFSDLGRGQVQLSTF
jgi:hypothetical protein